MRLALALCLFAALPAAAQDSPVVKILSNHWATTRTYTLAVAAQMPEDQYSFKPTPGQMSFGEQMLHIASANTYFFGKMAGVKPPAGPAKSAAADKAAVIKALTDSFDFVAAQMASMQDSQLAEVVDTGDGKMTRSEGVMLAFDHTAHHRGQTLVYLRLKGIVPTEYKF